MPREGVSPLSAGSHTASLLASTTVKRFWRNTQAANKNWAATEDPARPTLDDLRAWAIPVETARSWLDRDLITVQEFEGLVELALCR